MRSKSQASFPKFKRDLSQNLYQWHYNTIHFKTLFIQTVLMLSAAMHCITVKSLLSIPRLMVLSGLCSSCYFFGGLVVFSWFWVNFVVHVSFSDRLVVNVRMRKWLIYAIWSCEALGSLQIDITSPHQISLCPLLSSSSELNNNITSEVATNPLLLQNCN